MNTKYNQEGFSVVEILLVIVVVVLIGVVGLLVFDKQNNVNDDAKKLNSSKAATSNVEDGSKTVTENAKTTIHPHTGIGTEPSSTAKDLSYTTELPSGWSVQKVYEDYDIVKTLGSDKYLISSFIEHDGGSSAGRNIMEQRVAEGIETVATVQTSSGTSVSVLQTPTTLFLASCMPTGENCYLRLGGKNLYIHLYQFIPGAQSASNIDYSSDSAKEIIEDFKDIAKSLSI